MITVHIIANTVREIIPDEATQPSVAHWYGEEFAAQCVEAPNDVQQGYIYDAETGAFAPPPPPPEPEPPEPQGDIAQLTADVAELQQAWQILGEVLTDG